ncbi:hypothetical protein [Halococcus sp. AFM35]|uniref:hypothetical protein n=1 Tax=Halococcus sp. AFM35 TaxID=3421653 RepID=UPI003EBB5C7E
MADEDTTNEVQNRVAQRFDSDTSSEQSSSTERGEAVSGDSESASSRDIQKAQKAKNVKKAWNATSIYLPDDLDTKLSTAYKRADLQLSEDADISFKKTRHYYPVVIALGLERMENMESKEIMEVMEELSV